MQQHSRPQPGLASTGFAMAIDGVVLRRWHEGRNYESPQGLAASAPGLWLRRLKTDQSVMGELRRSLQALDIGLDLGRMTDDEVITETANLIARKVLRPCTDRRVAELEEGSLKTTARAKENPAVRRLIASDRRISLDGQQFRIIRAADWRRVREEGDYQVVAFDEARRTVSRISTLPGTLPLDEEALRAAMPLLAEQTFGRYSAGLLLLRIVPRRSFRSPSSEPVFTPSQLARVIKEVHWVAIAVVDEDGVAVPGVSYSIVAPDGQKYTGVTDANGEARVDNIIAGQCQISFPELDAGAYAAA